MRAIYQLPSSFMPENFPTQSYETPISQPETAPDSSVVDSKSLAEIEAPVLPELKKLDWEMGEFEGQPMLIAENLEVPEWYRDEGFEESEHRRPAIIFVSTGGKTSYRPSWIFFAERNVHQPFAEVATSEEAETIIAEYARAFSESESAEQYQHAEKQLMDNAVE